MTEHRSGFVAVIGRPNVGKSSLINALLEQKIAAVSPRPQTTRRRQLCILTTRNAQLVFIDTPGIHQPRHKLGTYMNDQAEAALEGVDVILFLVDLSSKPDEDDHRVAQLIRSLKQPPPVVLAANKLDLVAQDALPDVVKPFQDLLPTLSTTVFISATRGDGLGQLIEALIQAVPIGPPVYDEDQVTDLYEREIAADLIREACLLKLRDEVPHELGVRIDEYRERDGGLDYVRASLLVDRESQKGIVIGAGGHMLKTIGIEARRLVEAMTGRRAYLDLHVKVEKGWRNRENVLEQLGYKAGR